MRFTEICKALNELGSIAGTNAKMNFIKSHDDERLKEVYKWLFDNSRISGIAEKKFEKKVNSLFGDFGICDVKEITDVFDGMSLKEWDEKICLGNYSFRHEFLLRVSKHNNSDALNFLEDIYTGKDVSKIEELMKGIVREQDWEGLVIKFTDSEYEWKRSKNWLKVKAFEEMDLIVTGVEEGSNHNKGRLGALICEIEHPKLGHIEAKVGSGYSEEERNRFWKMKDELIGRVISVQYFEQTENTSTKIKSLRFPVFLELKEEGQEPNN